MPSLIHRLIHSISPAKSNPTSTSKIIGKTVGNTVGPVVRRSTSAFPPESRGFRASLGAWGGGIALLAAARLTRLITTDWIGEWFIVRPIRKWAIKHEGVEAQELIHEAARMETVRDQHGSSLRTHWTDPSKGYWRTKLASGLDCAHCVGFWVTAFTLLAAALPLPKPLSKVRDWLLAALAGSYVVGHISSKID